MGAKDGLLLVMVVIFSILIAGCAEKTKPVITDAGEESKQQVTGDVVKEAEVKEGLKQEIIGAEQGAEEDAGEEAVEGESAIEESEEAPVEEIKEEPKEEEPNEGELSPNAHTI